MTKRRRTAIEDKIRISKACIKGEIGVSEAGRLLGVDYHAVEDCGYGYTKQKVQTHLCAQKATGNTIRQLRRLR